MANRRLEKEAETGRPEVVAEMRSGTARWDAGRRAARKWHLRRVREGADGAGEGSGARTRRRTAWILECAGADKAGVEAVRRAGRTDGGPRFSQAKPSERTRPGRGALCQMRIWCRGRRGREGRLRAKEELMRLQPKA